MNRARLIIAAAITVILLGGAIIYAAVAFTNYERRQATPTAPQAAARSSVAFDGSPRIVFRNTTPDSGYGLVASVALSAPSGARSVTSVPCDRVYATTKHSMCLRIDRGVVTTFSANLLDSAGKTVHSWPLPGIPSRTRISPDSKLVGFTAFVTGAAYGSVGFSTETQIASTAGHDFGNLEDFALIVDGARNTATDRNFWGVTFTSNDNEFYATAASAGHTWLVRGDLAARTLTAIRESAECPSVSPDGRRVAYKKNVSTTASAYWSIAVLDLATGRETVLPEKQNVDDQVEWLDDSTILYGLARPNAEGDSDVWSIDADGATAPMRILQHAWSPSVVRP
ncbi:TolB family protein [Lacisediminihabitans sp.]|uniref:TolB family protein n=1 Tax=Lacisediminihabitans sp. TaxID=2787631 RepID=UPI00374C9691